MYYVYILTNKYNSVLYTGEPNDLERRLYEHRYNPDKKSFSYRYNTYKLVYYEFGESVYDAIEREKQIKGYRREKKVALIEKMNPQWRDLSEDW